MATINDIALKAGVAKSTVSRYLNGGSVSPETREKLEKIIKDLDYQPNVFAQSLKAKKTGLIGVVIPRLNSQATNSTLMGIDRMAKQFQQKLLIFNTYQSVDQELEGIKTFMNQKTDAIILIATQLTPAHYQLMRGADQPFMIIGQEAQAGTCVISYDDYDAGRQVAHLALAKGAKRILYVGVPRSDRAVGQVRAQGVLDTLQAAGVAADVLETSFHLTDAYQLGMEAIDYKAYDYIIAATDNIALGLLKAAYEKGVQIPQDVYLSGFGGYASADAVHPALTTVAYPYEEAGRLAMEKIQRADQAEDHLVLPVRLVEKASTQAD